MNRKFNESRKIEKHKITPGVTIDNIAYREELKRNSVAGIKTNDTKNRQYVINTIIENISKGMTEEEALDSIMQNDIVHEFEYLKNNGCNLKECFKNWIRGYISRRGKEFIK